MPERGASSGLQTRDLCRRSLEWTIQRAVLPDYHRTGKYRAPADPPHRLNFGKETWMLAHYADWRGPLYQNEALWRRSFTFVDGFSQKNLSLSNDRAWRLPRIFGSFGNVEPANVLAQVKSGLLRQGFIDADVDERSFTAVFRHSDSCETMDLPEPYGKWLQRRKGRMPWKDRLNLCVEAHCRVHGQPRLIPPYGNRSYLDLTLSAPAAVVLPPLREQLANVLRTTVLLNPGSAAELERTMVETLRALISSW